VNLKATVITVLALLASAALVFFLFERELAGAWFTFGVHPEVIGLLERSAADQKRLARADPGEAPAYRRRFDDIQALLGRLRILELSRREIVRRYEALLLGLFAGALALGSAVHTARGRRQERRLTRLQGALAELAAGGADVRVGERRRDLIGRIAAMVEETSRAIARDRRRLASLEHLSAWQEAARRQAHELRTPLTAARLELGRLRDKVAAGAAGADRGEGEAVRLAESALAEVDRLGRLTQAFAAFARLPEPALARRDLSAFLAEYVLTFAAAWPNLALRLSPPDGAHLADFDPAMVRQVLVNLCDNSSLALGERQGSAAFSLAAQGGWTFLTVADDGPGVAAAIRPRLFAPYATTRRVGEGMGLGLAISRKILLDHGGDLELAQSSSAGATFRLVFPRRAEGE
jgi:signal transduction histidine kinase